MIYGREIRLPCGIGKEDVTNCAETAETELRDYQKFCRN